MLSWLYGLDVRLFFLMNREYRLEIFDWLMPFATNPKNFKWPLVLVFLLILARRDKRLLITLAFLAVGLGVSDSLSSLAKSLFQRARPCQVLEGVNIIVGCGRSFSFPSNHAANIFAVAFLIRARHRGLGFFFFPVALFIAYSRVYVGVHFPSDVLGGAALGLGVGQAMIFCQEKARPMLSPDRVGTIKRWFLKVYEKSRGKVWPGRV